jgi:hypothetical protein
MSLSRRDNTPDDAVLPGFTNLRPSRTARPMVMEASDKTGARAA